MINNSNLEVVFSRSWSPMARLWRLGPTQNNHSLMAGLIPAGRKTYLLLLIFRVFWNKIILLAPTGASPGRRLSGYESKWWKLFLTSQKLVNTTFTLELDWTGITDKTSNSKHEGGNDHKSLRQVNCSFRISCIWKSLKKSETLHVRQWGNEDKNSNFCIHQWFSYIFLFQSVISIIWVHHIGKITG